MRAKVSANVVTVAPSGDNTGATDRAAFLIALGSKRAA